jgi:hypothetical protein
MSAIFPKWTNRLPLMIITGALLIGGAVTAGVWYYFTPKYTRVGYQPIQPVPFSHAIHAGQLGMDCRYCHTGVEKSWFSNIPAASTCMNCHSQVLKDDPRLAIVRESAASGQPIPWVQIHKLPDFAYFNHSVHVNRGISCVECHRHPELKLRPNDKITDLAWQPKSQNEQVEFGKRAMQEWKVESLQTCSACHR